MLRRAVIAAAVALLSSAAMVAPSAADGPTCSNFEPLAVQVHGQHVVRDYVSGGQVSAWPPAGGAVGAAVRGAGAALPGGPGPGFHFPNVAPGASFCIPQSESPGFHAAE